MLERIIEVAQGAGQCILKHYGKALPVETKSDESPLTQADLASHHHILDAIKDFDPSTPILSEESKALPYEERRPWTTFWLVDPLDGTKEFIKQTGQFTVNIARIHEGRSVLGVIYVPVSGALYWAQEGRGAFKGSSLTDSEPIQCRSLDPERLSIVASRDHAGPAVQRLLERFPEAETQSMGSSLKFCLVAEGKADLYLRDVPTMEWDTGAAQCIVEQAGGTVCALDGVPLSYNKENLRNPSLLTHGLSSEAFLGSLQDLF